MPTIKQLPTATSVAATDLLPLSQGGSTKALAVGSLLSSVQTALSVAPSKLLGRVSATAGGPEVVNVGTGLTIAAGSVAATGADHVQLPISPGLQAGDEVVVNSNGLAKRMAATMLRSMFTAGSGISIDSTGLIAATGGGSTGVSTFNTRSGPITLTSADVTGVGGALGANNLSDLASIPAARSNLGLGGAATLNVGTAAGTVAAGDDARITGAQPAATIGAAVITAPGASTGRSFAARASDRLTVKDFGAVGDGATDDTAAIQAAINYSSANGVPIYFQSGQYIVAGSLTAKQFMKLRGAGRTSTDGGYAQFGTQLWGTGGTSGAPLAAMLGSVANTANAHMEISDLSITASSASNYAWVVAISGMANSDINRVNVGNGGGRTTNGGVFFKNDAIGAPAGSYPVCWSNEIGSCQFGCSSTSGQVFKNQLTDSAFDRLYLSGGTGSLEAGENNRWSNFMVDNWVGSTNAGLTISPDAGNYTGLSTFSNGNFQNMDYGGYCIVITPDASVSTQRMDVLLSNISFNNSTSTVADLSINNASHVTVTGCTGNDSSTASILCAGTTDYVQVIGGVFAGTVTLVGANSAYVNAPLMATKAAVAATYAPIANPVFTGSSLTNGPVGFLYNSSGTIPSLYAHGAWAWNYTSGGEEIAQFNMVPGAVASFCGYQMVTAGSVVEQVYRFNPNGDLFLGAGQAQVATQAWVQSFSRGVYTASGAIGLSNTLAILNGSSGTLAMTVANGTVDGQSMLIKLMGAANATVTAVIDGASQTVAMTASAAGTIRDSLKLRWSIGDTSWLAE